MTDESEAPGVASDDPRVIRSVAVTTADVVTALEANSRRDAGAVLRITPPFAPRMRARLHRAGGEGDYGDGPRPIHVDPAALVRDRPPFPTPDDTEQALRADPDTEYSADRHRERHVERVEQWREAVRERVVESVTLSLVDGDHEVTVKALG
ncbi:hypothetical protein [Salinirubrum litoreum]|uniref:DUF8009 domain-containing protein n=1 Tax=Salinirubrum litoreum TaxID=1126234 RepID=A0ABD5R6Q3_9EURY